MGLINHIFAHLIPPRSHERFQISHLFILFSKVVNSVVCASCSHGDLKINSTHKQHNVSGNMMISLVKIINNLNVIKAADSVQEREKGEEGMGFFFSQQGAESLCKKKSLSPSRTHTLTHTHAHQTGVALRICCFSSASNFHLLPAALKKRP